MANEGKAMVKGVVGCLGKGTTFRRVPTADDGVKAVATDPMSSRPGIEGHYDPSCDGSAVRHSPRHPWRRAPISA